MRTEIPRIGIPYPSDISPDAEACRAHTLRWLSRQGLVVGPDALRIYDQMRIDRLTARTYPEVLGTWLNLANDFMAWGFIFDDQFDGPLGRSIEASRAALEEFLSVTRSETPRRYPSSPLAVAWVELWGRLVAGRSEAWVERFATSFVRYLQAQQREAVDWRDGVPGDLSTYLATRRETAGIFPWLDLGEPMHGYELPPEIVACEPMATMRSTCVDVVLGVNDICSARKEAAIGQTHNLVLLRMRDQGVDEASAQAWAIGQVESWVRAFEEAEVRMRQGVRTPRVWSEIDRSITTMKNWMRGNLDWSLESGRYSDSEQLRSKEGAWPWASLLNPSREQAKAS
ncbi:hypothetical protein VZQ01_41430 [Myxococcus faecalis]|uniref:terpene synthase family protein n=1 Tax=Myxococcus faecalis TaxID=3115646 RepID=UPI003CE694A7